MRYAKPVYVCPECQKEYKVETRFEDHLYREHQYSDGDVARAVDDQRRKKQAE